MNALLETFVILGKLASAVVLADFLAGVIHWIEDAYFKEDTPILGKLVIQPNIVHHHLPRYFTKLSWWESSRELVAVGFLVVLAAYHYQALTWPVWVFVVLSVNANQVHKWSHRTRAENGPIISWLQEVGILQTPHHHGLHHKDPKNTYYCPITNVVNPALEYVAFWTQLEKLIERVTGVTHREDTAVRGQGPGPAWLADFRPNRTVAPAGAMAIPIKTCPRHCAQCTGKCRSRAVLTGSAGASPAVENIPTEGRTQSNCIRSESSSSLRLNS